MLFTLVGRLYKAFPRLRKSAARYITSNTNPPQKVVAVYRPANSKVDKDLNETVEWALRKVWPKVRKYAAKKKVSRGLWAQIRVNYHQSGEPGSCSSLPHATICVFDENGRHVGGIHAPQDRQRTPTFKDGIHKSSYHGAKKIEKDLAFNLKLS